MSPTTLPPIKKFLKLLRDVVPLDPKHWEARCPVHPDADDHDLDINLKQDDQFDVSCEGGCSRDQILEKIGLNKPTRKRKSKTTDKSSGKATGKKKKRRRRNKRRVRSYEDLLQTDRNAVTVYATIQHLAGDKRIFRGQRKTIRGGCGLSERRITTAVAALHDCGWINLAKGSVSNVASWYIITLLHPAFRRIDLGSYSARTQQEREAP